MGIGLKDRIDPTGDVLRASWKANTSNAFTFELQSRWD